MNKSLLALLGALLLATVVGFAVMTTASEPAVEAAAAPAAVNVMDQPMDGSTVEAFEKGIEKVRTEGGAEAGKRLDAALQAMLFYDLSVKRDKTKLYAKLNGKTPNEIITQSAQKH